MIVKITCIKIRRILVITKQPKSKTKNSDLKPYTVWLAKQPLSIHAKRAYSARVQVFLHFRQKQLNGDDEALTRENRVRIATAFKKYLKHTRKLKPSSLNAYLAAVDNFYGFLNLGPAKVTREDLPNEAPRALSKQEQKKLLRAIERTRRAKDRAILTLLLYTGLRIGELSALENDDVYITGRKQRVIIRSGKGDKYRKVPLNSKVCEALQGWLDERQEKFTGRVKSKSFFLNAQGKKLLPGGIDLIVRKLGNDCGISLSAHILRHTLLTNLVRAKNDLILVADIAGHKGLNTIRRYALPSAGDKAVALESLLE